ncbi:unnamed protein product [Sympodiomycopsis kandeliae]
MSSWMKRQGSPLNYPHAGTAREIAKRACGLSCNELAEQLRKVEGNSLEDDPSQWSWSPSSLDKGREPRGRKAKGKTKSNVDGGNGKDKDDGEDNCTVGILKSQNVSETSKDKENSKPTGDLSDEPRSKKAKLTHAERQSSSTHEFEVHLYTPEGLTEALQDSIFSLFEANMKPMYEKEGLWDPWDKQCELWNSDSRFLCVFTRSDTTPLQDRLAGLIGFRFDTEKTVARDVYYKDLFCDRNDYPKKVLPVIYCYEIQINSQYRGIGLGRQLMYFIEELGRLNGMVKCMLTVFEANHPAKEFYYRFGYDEDGISPKPKENAGYLILSMGIYDLLTMWW